MWNILKNYFIILFSLFISTMWSGFRKCVHRLTRDGGLPVDLGDLGNHDGDDFTDSKRDRMPNITNTSVYGMHTGRRNREYNFSFPILKYVKTRNDLICFSVLLVISILFLCTVFLWNSRQDSDINLRFQNVSILLHPKHSEKNEIDTEYVGLSEPYPGITSVSFKNEHDVPDYMFEHCRPLTEEELMQGLTIKGHLIPELLLRMCKLLHDEHGCLDSEGTLVPKLLNNMQKIDNFCLITYKDKKGICHHYINPSLRHIGSAEKKELTVHSRHFPYLGMHILALQNQIMMTYQPLVGEQPIHSKQKSQDIPEAAYSDAMKELEENPASNEFWLTSIPEKRTEGITKTKAYYIGHAYSLLMGEYPPPRENNRHVQNNQDFQVLLNTETKVKDSKTLTKAPESIIETTEKQEL